MTTRDKQTRFMNGNIDLDGEVLDILVEKYGHGIVYSCGFDFSDALYSDGFVTAIEDDLTPIIDSITPSYIRKSEDEYHHVIFNNECYVMYFE